MSDDRQHYLVAKRDNWGIVRYGGVAYLLTNDEARSMNDLLRQMQGGWLVKQSDRIALAPSP